MVTKRYFFVVFLFQVFLGACSNNGEVGRSVENDGVESFEAKPELVTPSSEVELVIPSLEVNEGERSYSDNVSQRSSNEVFVSGGKDKEEEEQKFAGEEFYPVDPEFSPAVKEAIDLVEEAVSLPTSSDGMNEEYRKLAEVLESQIDQH